jgi:hypothetical protein
VKNLEALRFVVGGTPRGGTVYMSNILKALGLDAGHEDVFPVAGPITSVTKEVDVSGGVHHHLDEIAEYGVPVVQLLRHPVSTINSMLIRWRGHRRWDQERSITYWTEAHRALASVAHVQIYLEDPYPGLYTLGQWLRMGWGDRQIFEAALRADRGRSTPGERVNWSDLPVETQVLADGFGYGGCGSLRKVVGDHRLPRV